MKNVPYVLEYIYSRFHKYWLRIDCESNWIIKISKKSKTQYLMSLHNKNI
jgi:hypothetical protein